MDINPEVRERILNAAQQQFEAAGRLELGVVSPNRRIDLAPENCQILHRSNYSGGFLLEPFRNQDFSPQIRLQLQC
jgi:hypothetical protein